PILGIRHFFFFPAEVGIRVFHVTGVQTCALPILRVRPKKWRVRSTDYRRFRGRGAWRVMSGGNCCGPVWLRAAVRRGQCGAGSRSVERRGGKGGRVGGKARLV